MGGWGGEGYLSGWGVGVIVAYYPCGTETKSLSISVLLRTYLVVQRRSSEGW